MFKSYSPHASPGHHPAKINWQSIANSVSLSIRLAPSLMGLYSEWRVELSHLQARPDLCTSVSVAGTVASPEVLISVPSNRGWPGARETLGEYRLCILWPNTCHHVVPNVIGPNLWHMTSS